MRKVLVAEDSFALANLLEFVLTNAGFDVAIFRTGAAAYAAVLDCSFDLILLDQQMPKMTGVEVLQGLRAAGPNQETPVFLCTAKVHELDLEELTRALNLAGVFHKPFSPKDLVEQLRNASQPIALGGE